MKTPISDALLRSLKPAGGQRVEISDTVRPGLRIRIAASGRRTWIFEKRIRRGPKRTYTLGTYPQVTVKDAWARALELHLEAVRGIDRVANADAAAKEREAEALRSSTVRQALEAFNAMHLSNLRTGKEVHRALSAALLPLLDEPANSLTRGALQRLIDEKAASGAKIQANRLQAYLSKFAKFAWMRDYIDTHVGRGLEKAVKEAPRERELSLEEVRAIWEATFKLSPTAGSLVRLLLLTAQRLNEIARLRWSEINEELGQIELRGARTKNGKCHITHLSRPAQDILRGMKVGATSEYVFSTIGSTPFSGFFRVKQQLDRHLEGKVKDWRFHDFRTAFATTMAERGEPEAVIDRMLNHVAMGSAPSVVARIYNRAQHLEARARILESWGQIVTGGPADGNVVPIRAEAA